MVPVSGRLTVDGKPIANATVCTMPIAESKDEQPGPGSTGVTDANGEFVLKFQATDTDLDGATPGKVRLVILESDGKKRESSDDTGTAFRHRIPTKYRDGNVTYDIPEEGTDAMNIEIDGKKRG